MSEHPEDSEGQAPGSAGKSGDQLSHEDVAALRVREASPGDRVGRGLHSGPHKRHLPAADILPSVSKMPSLLPAESGPVQGEVAQRLGERGQASVETHQGVADQQPCSRETLVEMQDTTRFPFFVLPKSGEDFEEQREGQRQRSVWGFRDESRVNRDFLGCCFRRHLDASLRLCAFYYRKREKSTFTRRPASHTLQRIRVSGTV